MATSAPSFKCFRCNEYHSSSPCPKDVKASGLKHVCMACMQPEAAAIAMHSKNGDNKLNSDGEVHKYCVGHWEFIMQYSPTGTRFEIELLV